MDAALVLGAIGTFTGLARPLPQLVRLVRIRDAHGVSLDTAATSCVVSSAWATYGVLEHHAAVALASGLSAILFSLIALLALRLGRHVRELRAAPVWFVAVVGASALGGAAGLGIVLVAGALVANLPQVVVAFRERDLSGLSPSAWALTASDGATWFVYGLLTGDVPIFVNNSFQFSTSAAIVARRWLWSRRAVPAEASTDDEQIAGPPAQVRSAATRSAHTGK